MNQQASAHDPSCFEAPAIDLATEADRTEWNRFVIGHPKGTIDHLWQWRVIFNDVFGHESTYLIARRDARTVGVLPLVRFNSKIAGRSLMSLPFLNYGGVLSVDSLAGVALVGRAREIASRMGASHVELRHATPQFEELPGREHKLGFVRQLASDVDALWTSLDRKIRNQVRKAQKDGLTARVGGPEHVNDFYRVFARNMRDLGTPVYPRQLFSETLRLFPDAARVYLVHSGDTVAAAAIALRFRDTVLVPWASSLREYRQQCANTLLYWTMLEDAVQCGARVFDFGRSSPGSGPHHFKRQWGAQEAPLHWEYVLLGDASVPTESERNEKFALAVSVWKRLPLWLTNLAGPRVVRHLP